MGWPISDTFTDTDGTAILSHTTDDGSSWARHNSSFTANPTITGNVLNGGFNLYSAFFINSTPPSNDYIISCNITVSGGGDAGNGAGIMGRVTQSSSATFYSTRMRTNVTVLEQFSGGSGTTLDTLTYSLLNETYYLEMVFNGTSIDTYLQRVSNGNWINSSGSEVGTKVPCLSATDSTLTTGSVGILSRQFNYSFDNFSAEELDLSTSLTADSAIAFTQSNTRQGSWSPTAENTISFTQAAEAIVSEIELTASNTIAFTQAASAGFYELTGSNSISFSQSASVAFPQVYNLTADNSIAFTQASSSGLLTRTANNYLAFSQSNIQSGESELTAGNTISFSQSSSPGLLTRTAHNNLEITQEALGGFVSVNAIGLSASDTLTFTQEVNRGLALASGTSLTADNTLTFTQRAIFPIDLTADNTIAFTQSADGVPGKSGTHTISFVQTVVANHWRNLTASSSITFAQGFSATTFRNGLPIQGTGCDATKTYSPFSGGTETPLIRPVAPALNRKTDVEFFYPTGPACSATNSIILRTPNFGDRDRNQYSRINRESRGGSLRIYRDPQWPKVRTLVMDFSGIKDTEISDILTFLEDTLGQQIAFRDWNSRVWYGLIVNPDTAITRTGKANRNDVSIEMEVTDTGLEVNACNVIEFTQSAIAVVE